MDGSEALNMLVSVSELQVHLHDAHWCVVDVRHDLFDLEAGMRAYLRRLHPGAVFADIDRDLSGKTGTNGRHPLPRRDDWSTLFADGVSATIRRSLPTTRRAASLLRDCGGWRAGSDMTAWPCSTADGRSGGPIPDWRASINRAKVRGTFEP